ncbi:hypothetical protein IFM89_033076 [Coptis chinensis]|uniref:DUF4283 domain-containing protein n=1 Tax=Coptis chinensis TaxID=261450 RepID=A0A835MAU1_9MAGN|nr:hypothetical protein IFM89_033076 [Coptis chinensis]
MLSVSLSKKRLSYPFVKEDVNKQWKLKGGFDMMVDKGRIFVVRAWSAAVENHRSRFTALPIWVKMDLSKQLWTKNRIDFVSIILEQCTTCKIFGHSDAKCHKNKAKAVEIQPTQAFKPAKPHQKTQ